MKIVSKTKQFLNLNLNLTLVLCTLILSFCLSIIAIQFFLRFLLTDWARVLIITPIVTVSFFPITLFFLKAYVLKLTDNVKRKLLPLVGISLILSSILYIVSPVKITGNLLLLDQPNLLLYRISRLINIISFLLAAGFAFLISFSGIIKKFNNWQLWKLTGVAFFSLLLLVGLFVFKDYGISSDEPNERTNGLVSAQYFADYIEEILPEIDPYLPKISSYRYRYYGVAYQFPLAIIEQNVMLQGQSIWQFRHMANFLFFYCGVLALFHVLSDYFSDGRYGLLGALLLVTTPRIFAHAFFNPKDAIFLAAFTIALHFCLRYWKQTTAINGLIAGISVAYAANVRIIAISLSLISLGLFTLDLIKDPKNITLKPILVKICSTVLFIFIFWPASWQAPLEYFTETIRLFSDYVYWDFRVMYLGNFIRGNELPWHYLPVWMGITIPIIPILLFIVGVYDLINQTIKCGKKIFFDHHGRTALIILCLFLAPITLAIFLKSTLYNGWRHFYFVYIPFLFIAILGTRMLIYEIKHSSPQSFKWVVFTGIIIGLGVNLIFTTIWMVRNHPHQIIYFNKIGYVLGRQNFERDYWRISMKEGVEIILAHDKDDQIKICAEEQFSESEFLKILPEDDRSRIRMVTDENLFFTCDYSIDTYRKPKMFTCSHHFHSITVDGLPILSIYKCTNP